MKKIIYITLLLLGILSLFLYLLIPVQKKAFIGEWYVMGDSESANTTWDISWLNKVDPDRYWDTEDSYPIRYKISESSNKIIVRDAYFEDRIEFEGEILSMSKDTIRLGTKDSLLYWHDFLTFIKLKNKTNTHLTFNDLINNLENNSWIYEDVGLEFRLDFKNDHLYGDSTMPKLVNHNSINGGENDAFARWRLKNFNDQIILSIYSLNFNNGVIDFFLQEVYKDSIVAERSFGKYFHPITLTKIPTDPLRDKTIANLQSKKWIANNAIQLEQNYSSSTLKPYYYQNEDYDLNLHDLKNGLVSFEFTNDGRFKLYKNSERLFESTWELSSDSRFVFIDDRFTSKIEILEISENELDIRLDLMVWGETDITKYSHNVDGIDVEFDYGLFYQILFELNAQ